MAVADARLYAQLSLSSRRAFAFAWAASRHRSFGGSDAEVEQPDLLVGILLAHPDSSGEGSVLLAHFGLTGRDVLPAGYPSLRAPDLQRQVRRVGLRESPPLSPPVMNVMRAAQDLARHASATGIELRHLLGGLLETDGPLQETMSVELRARGASLTGLTTSYRSWLVTELDATTVAGQDLRKVLLREHPRRPVDVPTYAADRADSGTDLIGIRDEVDAFAYLLASKALHPPLAVGLFGDWGSGKSFFMSTVKSRIDEIGAQIRERPQADVPFWKEVRQIEFNAWQYVQGSLWASLLHHIFATLGGTHLPLVMERRKALERAGRDAKRTADSEKERRDDLTKAIKKGEKELQAAEQERDRGLQGLARERADLLSEDVQKQATSAMHDAYGVHGSRIVGADAVTLLAALGEAGTQLSRTRGLLGGYWSRGRVLLATLAALGVPLLAFALDQLGLPPAVSVLGGLSAVVPTVTLLLQSATSWTRDRLDKIEAARQAVETQLTKRANALQADVEAARENLEAARTSYLDAKSAEQAADRQAAGLRSELEHLTAERVLSEFLRERSRSGEYLDHLGLLSKVRDDLTYLEGLVRENNTTHLSSNSRQNGRSTPLKDPPPNRIILYIDDLDRCPSDKVVEVLEAVHLLLAFELFVVVVAVDARWLSFALTDELKALTADTEGSRPTPQDYLEKIFQLPFWVQPLPIAGRRSLVHGLLEGVVTAGDGARSPDGADEGQLSIDAPERALLDAMLSRRGADPQLEANALTLRPEDLAFMESLAPLLGGTPRRVKRFVNIALLLLAMPPALSLDGANPSDRAVVAFLAAVNAGLPALARELFACVERDPAQTLKDAVEGLTCDVASEKSRLLAWLAEQPGWAPLPLLRLNTRLDAIRRLTFEREAPPSGQMVPLSTGAA